MTKIRLHDSSGDQIAVVNERIIQTREFRAANVERITFGPFETRIEPRSVSVGSLPPAQLDVFPSVEPGAEMVFLPGDLIVGDV